MFSVLEYYLLTILLLIKNYLTHTPFVIPTQAGIYGKQMCSHVTCYVVNQNTKQTKQNGKILKQVQNDIRGGV